MPYTVRVAVPQQPAVRCNHSLASAAPINRCHETVLNRSDVGSLYHRVNWDALLRYYRTELNA